MPINLMFNQVTKIGTQPVSLQMGLRHHAESPSGGPEWGIRMGVTLLFPKE